MTHTVVILKDHPSNPDLLLIKTPPSHGPSPLRDFGPARFAENLYGWVIPADLLGSFEKFAENHGIAVEDSRGTVKRVIPDDERPLMPECANCGQPAKADNQPRVCPACGYDWKPTYVTQLNAEPVTRTQCPSCGHWQGQRFAYCSRCGGPMSYRKNTPAPKVVRENLPEPMSLGDTLTEMVHARSLPTYGATHSPVMHKPGDVNLPEPEVPLPDAVPQPTALTEPPGADHVNPPPRPESEIDGDDYVEAVRRAAAEDAAMWAVEDAEIGETQDQDAGLPPW